jgi:hypothetical protein
MSDAAPSLDGTMSIPIPHPWREFAKWPNARVFFRDLSHGVHGKTDGRDVWIHNKLLQVERRCAAAHEQEHLRRGHTRCVPGAEEDRVRHAAAKWLVPNPRDVASAIVWAGGDYDLAADHLWLDRPSFDARVNRRYMHMAEGPLIDKLVAAELHP